MKMGEMIRTLRRKTGKTQETLAEALGMSTQAVSRWESGGGYPDVEMIPRIANYFHVSIDESLLNPRNCKQISKIFSPYLTAADDGNGGEEVVNG